MNPPAAEGAASLPPARVSLAVMLILATLASVLGIVASGDNQLGFDIRVLEAAQRVDLPGLDILVRLSNTIFGTTGALALGGIYMMTALLVHRSIFVLQLVLVIVLRLLGQVLKPMFDSPRPPIEYQPDPSLVSSSLGYPSGHAYTASVITTMVVLLVFSLAVPRWTKWLTLILAIGAAVTAMFSRIAVGAHWPTDTLGGIMYGIATVALMQVLVGAILGVRQRGMTETRDGRTNSLPSS